MVEKIINRNAKRQKDSNMNLKNKNEICQSRINISF
jgi:hypothetical protein